MVHTNHEQTSRSVNVVPGPPARDQPPTHLRRVEPVDSRAKQPIPTQVVGPPINCRHGDPAG